MNLARMTISLILMTSLGLAACGAESPATPAPAATATPVRLLTDPQQATVEAAAIAEQPTATPTPMLAPAETSRPAPTATNRPTNTLVPTLTATPTPTPEPEPVIKVDEASTTAINVRAGPGTDYPVIGQLRPGEASRVTGRTEDSSWWQIDLAGPGDATTNGWIFGELVVFSGDNAAIPIAEAPPPPPTLAPEAVAEAETEANPEVDDNYEDEDNDEAPPPSGEELAQQLDCGKDFCVTYQAMLPIWENGGCVGNHSIYITVLEGLPPGKPMDGVVVGDTFNNVEVGSGSHGPGRTEITLWNNSMTLIVKRHMDGRPYTSEESFNFTSHDELIPAEVLAANGYCDGDVEKCRWAQQNNQVCRGHYSWRVTFHKFD